MRLSPKAGALPAPIPGILLTPGLITVPITTRSANEARSGKQTNEFHSNVSVREALKALRYRDSAVGIMRAHKRLS